MPDEALLTDPGLVRIFPVPPTQYFFGRKALSLRSELTVAKKVGPITDAGTPSDGPRRRDTTQPAYRKTVH